MKEECRPGRDSCGVQVCGAGLLFLMFRPYFVSPLYTCRGLNECVLGRAKLSYRVLFSPFFFLEFFYYILFGERQLSGFFFFSFIYLLFLFILQTFASFLYKLR